MPHEGQAIYKILVMKEDFLSKLTSDISFKIINTETPANQCTLRRILLYVLN
jgi:hypothetical protein